MAVKHRNQVSNINLHNYHPTETRNPRPILKQYHRPQHQQSCSYILETIKQVHSALSTTASRTTKSCQDQRTCNCIQGTIALPQRSWLQALILQWTRLTSSCNKRRPASREVAASWMILIEVENGSKIVETQITLQCMAMAHRRNPASFYLIAVRQVRCSEASGGPTFRAELPFETYQTSKTCWISRCYGAEFEPH